MDRRTTSHKTQNYSCLYDIIFLIIISYPEGLLSLKFGVDIYLIFLRRTDGVFSMYHSCSSRVSSNFLAYRWVQWCCEKSNSCLPPSTKLFGEEWDTYMESQNYAFLMKSAIILVGALWHFLPRMNSLGDDMLKVPCVALRRRPRWHGNEALPK